MDHLNKNAGNDASNLSEERLIIKRDHIDETWKSIKIDGLEAFKTSTTKFGKLFWLLMMCIASAVLIYELYKSVDDYLNSPTVATYKIEPRAKMNFPDVYLCNTNFVKQSQLVENNRTKRAAYSYNKLIASWNLNTNEECLQNATESDSDLTNATQSYHDFMTLGYNVDEFFLACSFRSYVFDPINCTEIVKPVLDPLYGKCFIISLPDRQQILGAQALMLVLYLYKEEYPDDPCLTPDTEGLALSVGHPPLIPVDTPMTYVKPGTYNRVDLTSRQLSFINVNTSRIKQLCVNNEDRYEFFVFNNNRVNYSQTACQRDCLLKTIIATCNCLPIMDINYVKPKLLTNNARYCSVRENRECVANRVAQSKSAEEAISNCSSRCYPSCSMRRYPVRVTSLPLNGRLFPADYKVENIIYLMIAFVNMEMEIFQQNPSKSIDDMISNLGGQINLWVGSSMLTLIQLPIVLCMMCGWAMYELAQRCRS